MTTNQPADRLRPRPRERFAPKADQMNLHEAAQNLWAEPASGQHGHRQMALFRHGPATLALYCFEAGSKLADHVVDGSVIIHTLRGKLTVSTSDGPHELREGSLLRLAPGVPHDVEASETSEMLLTVCLEGPASRSLE